MVLKTDDSNFGVDSHELKGVRDSKKLLSQLQKSYGESFQIGDTDRQVDVVSTGSLLLDVATGIGGYPRGRIIQLAGWESSGKTTHALKAAANLQAQGGSVAFIDTEYALDPKWAIQLGVDMAAMMWLQVDDLETAGEIAVDLADSGTVDMIIFDSVAGAPIKAVVEGEVGDANMGKRAKIMSTLMPKLNGPVARNNVWMIFTNQLRDSLNPYQPKPVTPGGHALAFHSSMIIELKAKKIRPASGKNVTHVEITATLEKNKLSPPGRVVTYTMDFDGFIDVIGELASIIVHTDNAEALGVARAGSWYTLPAEMLPGIEDLRFQGRDRIVEVLAEVDLFNTAREYVLSRLR